MRTVTTSSCNGEPCLKGKQLENTALNMLDLQVYVDDLLDSPGIEVQQ